MSRKGVVAAMLVIIVASTISGAALSATERDSTA